MKILSIDWDYFVDCRILAERVSDDSFYEGMAWAARIAKWEREGKTLEKQVPLVGPSFLFFRNLFDLSNLKKSKIFVGDSHHGILSVIPKKEKALEILNVDMHHDILYSSEDFEDFRKGQATSGCWGGLLISQKRVSIWKQIYPAWRRGSPEGKNCMYGNFDAAKLYGKDFGAKVGITLLSKVEGYAPDLLFICRSSPWTPPQYDSKFSELCSMFTGQPAKKFRFPRANFQFSKEEK